MNCTCLKSVFDDMALLRVTGVEMKEEEGRPMLALAWRTAALRMRDNITRGSDDLSTDTSVDIIIADHPELIQARTGIM